eukprot:8460166-Pyramimonas_sp.AAC.1
MVAVHGAIAPCTATIRALVMLRNTPSSSGTVSKELTATAREKAPAELRELLDLITARPLSMSPPAARKQMARPRFSNPFIKLRGAAADTPQANDESDESQEDVYPIFAQYNGKTATA